MRTEEIIFAEFDDPMQGEVSQPDSTVNSIRDRAVIEILLNIRELLVEIKDAIDECKDELVEIKENTA
jgi:hypothetical protein